MLTGEVVIEDVQEILPEMFVIPAQFGAVDKVCVVEISLDQYSGILITNCPVEGIELEGEKLKKSFDEVRIVAELAEILHAIHKSIITLKSSRCKCQSSRVDII